MLLCFFGHSEPKWLIWMEALLEIFSQTRMLFYATDVLFLYAQHRSFSSKNVKIAPCLRHDGCEKMLFVASKFPCLRRALHHLNMLSQIRH